MKGYLELPLVEQTLRKSLDALDLSLWSKSGAHVFNSDTALADLARSLQARLVVDVATPEADLRGVGLDVERLARALHVWEEAGDPDRLDVSASIGVAVYENGDLQTAQEIAAEYAREQRPTPEPEA